MIEVYRGNQKAEHHLGIYSLYVLFFPQLVAGPIERPQNLLHQFREEKIFNKPQIVDGLRQILWGLFKKIVVADNLANYTDQIYGNYENLPASTLVLGAIYFSVQIYCDFSGYSEIALGSAKLLGINLMINFNNPYFSRDIAEFWRRWHISLSTWFRDYVYYPLGGSKVSTFKVIRNTLIIFTLSGFWHGANWTFIIWGFVNAIYFIPLLLLKKNRVHVDSISNAKLMPSLKEFSQILLTFSLTTLAWIFFRSDTVSDAFAYIAKIFDRSFLTPPSSSGIQKCLPLITLMFFIEWVQRNKPYAFDLNRVQSRTVRWSIYYLFIVLLILFGGSQKTFIYFQF